MTDLLTFIEATKGTSLKIEVTSKDLLEFADALVEWAAAKARAEIERQSEVEYIPKSPKARCVFVRRSLPNSDAFIL